MGQGYDRVSFSGGEKGEAYFGIPAQISLGFLHLSLFFFYSTFFFFLPLFLAVVLPLYCS